MRRSDPKNKYVFMFPLKKLARKGLRPSIITMIDKDDAT